MRRPNPGRSSSRALTGLHGDKKKTVMALCLLGVMVVMWVRVLTRKTPSSAQAGLVAAVRQSGDSAGSLKVVHVELPKVAGRHDTLYRDLFVSTGWKGFARGSRQQRSLQQANTGESTSAEELSQVVAGLELEAIVTGDKPQAFINGKLLSPGDTLWVSDGHDRYAFEVVEIKPNRVCVKCGQNQFVLSLAMPGRSDE